MRRVAGGPARDWFLGGWEGDEGQGAHVAQRYAVCFSFVSGQLTALQIRGSISGRRDGWRSRERLQGTKSGFDTASWTERERERSLEPEG